MGNVLAAWVSWFEVRDMPSKITQAECLRRYRPHHPVLVKAAPAADQTGGVS